MATVNLKFNQLLMGVRSRVQGESKATSNIKSVPDSTTTTSSEGPKGLSISKVTSVSSNASVGSSSKKAEVVFSLKDFIENKKAREEEDKANVEDVKMEEVEEKAAESSDESVIDDEESMEMEDVDEEEDSDLEVIKSDKEEKKTNNKMEDSDIENEITKLHDIIGELSKADESKVDDVKIVEEKMNKDPEPSLDNQATKESINIDDDKEVKSENIGLGKFSGLSIKKNSIPEETERKKDDVKESTKNSAEDSYEWQNMEAAAEAKNDQEVKIEGSPVFRSAPIPTIAGLPPGLKVEIKEVQGKRWNIFT